MAYSKLYQSLEVDSSVLFQQITSIEYHWHQQELPYQQVSPTHTADTQGTLTLGKLKYDRPCLPL